MRDKTKIIITIVSFWAFCLLSFAGIVVWPEFTGLVYAGVIVLVALGLFTWSGYVLISDGFGWRWDK